ncbi:unnamed protein product [Brassicogethes aeneus]|uniref:MYND-type domain-containing protein n=1 Tax=Brassicogethes aeneus TaxID=1431903 RepID=A0A9P0AS38_BRAAE|nr:unnamed protein product [Brassicogethes aeneus]
MKMSSDSATASFVDEQEKPTNGSGKSENEKLTTIDGIGDSDITKAVTISEQQEQQDDEPNASEFMTQECAVDEFLAGEDKTEYNDDILLEDAEGISFKVDNDIIECKFVEEQDPYEEEEEHKEKNESLNKMHIMEDVREGCNVQPSSPGHANTNKDPKGEIGQENGFKPDNVHTEIELYNGIKEEKRDSEGEGEKSPNANHLNDDGNSNSSSDTHGRKRKSESDESPAKRLRTDIQENFTARDKIFNDYIELTDCSTIEQIQSNTEQVLRQIRTLNELAKEKEREWNNIIHLKKIKEELLLRMQRRKQTMLLGESDLLLGDNDPAPKSSNAQRLYKNTNGIDIGLVDFRQGKRPVIDVQSLIADYRQRHPEQVPRRGRRIRSMQNESRSIVNMALGSGASVKQNTPAPEDLSMMNALSNLSNESMLKDNASFKDMLVHLAQLSQGERNELIQNAIKPPPPYPEVTVHPVPTTTSTHTNSLLHGILTKSPQKSNSKTSFSPTLARLLTAPERANSNHATSTPTISNSTLGHPPNMSISEILSSNKARNEITITPVGFETPEKRKHDDEESEDHPDRLVIDESTESAEGRRGDNSSDTGDDVPQCQGCNLKAAQFVCAGCGNQWYCSRDCQVSAWDEHSEICSG